ncbi:MAG: zinc ribbon domain-containing protein [bacterium]|nr:zinc ribbon domain-containing protein [bacterium]
MDFCSNCGDKTDPDWVFCRSCGGVLEDDAVDGLAVPIPRSSGTPKVELISRGWDVIEVDILETVVDPIDDDGPLPEPLPPQSVSVTVDDVTVVETVEDPVVAEEQPTTASDTWAHLRPGGELPPLRHHVSTHARIGQVAVLLSALTALVSAGLHFYHNTRLDAFGDGRITAETLQNVDQITQTSRYVVAASVLLALVALGWWFVKKRATADLRPDKAGLAALLSFLAAGGIIAGSLAIHKDTTTKAIGFNSLIVLGLGLLIAACLATVRTVERIDLQEPA